MMRKLEDLNKDLESSEFRRGYILFFTFTFGFTLIFSLVFYIKSPTPTPTPTASTKEAKAQCYRASKQNWRYYRSNVSPRCRLQTQPHPPSQNEIESYIKPGLGLMGTAKEEEIFRRQSSISEMKNPHLPEHSASQDVGTMDEIVDDPEIDSFDSCESRKSHGIESDKLLKPVKYRHKEKKARQEEDEEIDLGDYESLEFGADFVEYKMLTAIQHGSQCSVEGSKLDGEALSFAVKAQMLPMHPMMYEETDEIVYNEELGENVAYGFIAEERQAMDIEVRKMWQKVRNCADLSESSNRLTRFLQVYHQIRRQRPDEKILVFSQYLKFLDLIDETIRRKYNVQSLRFESTVTQVRRVQVQNDFEAAHPSVPLLMTARARQFGLNVTAASIVIQCELWWNESNELQAICRAHRKKQTRDVLAVQLFGSNSDIDWEILGTQRRKATVNSGLMEAIIRKPDDGPDIRELYSHPVPHPM